MNIGISGAQSSRRQVWELLIVSAISLFVELMVIRWLSTEVRIFAYFKNLPLMSAFLGLGLGFIWSSNKRDFSRWSSFALLCLSGVLILALNLKLTYLSFLSQGRFMLFGVGEDAVSTLVAVRSLLIMIGLFCLSTFVFVGLGQRMGRLFGVLRPLQAYSINVFGALIGATLFSVLCFADASPAVWLFVAGVLYWIIDKSPSSVALAALGLIYGIWLGPLLAQSSFGSDLVKTVWSPYYRIDAVRFRVPEGPYKGIPLGYNIYINYDSFQSIVDCTDKTLSLLPKEAAEQMKREYECHFAASRSNPRVLVLGSGTGSDVAGALRCGASHVDAVEIDPSIAQLGRELNPEAPYSSPRVTVYVTDARNFLKNCHDKYDVIIFGALDSHAAFSALSSLRMDNYVFTQEAINEALGLLKPDGIVSVRFVVPAEWLWARHAKALTMATGYPPFGFRKDSVMKWGLLLAGPGIAKRESITVPGWQSVGRVSFTDPAVPVSTDDWPFLFLPRRELPAIYILPILAVLALSFVPVALQLARGSSNLLNWQMLTLGMAFMLLEVRAMADLSLVYGSTWIVNSVIISAVMVVILIANWVVSRVSTKAIPWLGLGVIASLAFSTLVSPADFARWGPLSGGILGSALYLFPLVLAAMIFALLFRDSKSASTALAFNLIGGMFGVCIEYLSMSLGIRALGWIGVALYAVVLLLQLRITGIAKVKQTETT